MFEVPAMSSRGGDSHAQGEAIAFPRHDNCAQTTLRFGIFFDRLRDIARGAGGRELYELFGMIHWRWIESVSVAPDSSAVQAQIDTYLTHLEGLIHRGRKLRDTLATDPSGRAALAANRIWQQDCGITINQLSGGSKAHWLARSFSEAFLMRSTAGSVVETAAPAEIVNRLVDVLEQAVTSLSGMRDSKDVVTSSETAPSPRRFDFVHNPELRPVVEQAYSDGRRDLEEHRFNTALLAFCGILEAIVTDALQHSGVPAEEIADWTFEARLAVAERAGLIRGGCARLPEIARRYRDLPADVMVSEQEARQTGQVLQVVMRDLDPGR
jgi:hypothetical protein